MHNLQSLFYTFLLLMFVACSPQSRMVKKKEVSGGEGIMLHAVSQYKMLAAKRPVDSLPKTYHEPVKRHEWSNTSWWTSGFFPGTLLYLYEETGDASLKQEALRVLKILEKEQFNKGTHDLGFMMFNSFGMANRIDPKPEYRDVLVNSARSLASRFNPKVGCIRSWNSRQPGFVVIIDNMMNLELLFWASRVSGDSGLYQIALTHANTTIKNHFRPDYSSWHVVEYDENTGQVREKRTAQGYNNQSAWARGQAWGLYGFTMCFRETKNQAYLDQANKIAAFLLNHPNLPTDKIPYWDFNAPDIPNALRDASAAAIIASALIELSDYVGPELSSQYYKAAQQILSNLSSPDYLAAPGTNGGFILKHGVGHKPAGTEVDVPLTYGDYYFIEALRRQKMRSR